MQIVEKGDNSNHGIKKRSAHLPAQQIRNIFPRNRNINVITTDYKYIVSDIVKIKLLIMCVVTTKPDK